MAENNTLLFGTVEIDVNPAKQSFKALSDAAAGSAETIEQQYRLLDKVITETFNLQKKAMNFGEGSKMRAEIESQLKGWGDVEKAIRATISAEEDVTAKENKLKLTHEMLNQSMRTSILEKQYQKATEEAEKYYETQTKIREIQFMIRREEAQIKAEKAAGANPDESRLNKLKAEQEALEKIATAAKDAATQYEQTIDGKKVNFYQKSGLIETDKAEKGLADNIRIVNQLLNERYDIYSNLLKAIQANNASEIQRLQTQLKVNQELWEYYMGSEGPVASRDTKSFVSFANQKEEMAAMFENKALVSYQNALDKIREKTIQLAELRERIRIRGGEGGKTQTAEETERIAAIEKEIEALKEAARLYTDVAQKGSVKAIEDTITAATKTGKNIAQDNALKEREKAMRNLLPLYAQLGRAQAELEHANKVGDSAGQSRAQEKIDEINARKNAIEDLNQSIKNNQKLQDQLNTAQSTAKNRRTDSLNAKDSEQVVKQLIAKYQELAKAQGDAARAATEEQKVKADNRADQINQEINGLEQLGKQLGLTKEQWDKVEDARNKASTAQANQTKAHKDDIAAKELAKQYEKDFRELERLYKQLGQIQGQINAYGAKGPLSTQQQGDLNILTAKRDNIRAQIDAILQLNAALAHNTVLQAAWTQAQNDAATASQKEMTAVLNNRDTVQAEAEFKRQLIDLEMQQKKAEARMAQYSYNQGGQKYQEAANDVAKLKQEIEDLKAAYQGYGQTVVDTWQAQAEAAAATKLSGADRNIGDAAAKAHQEELNRLYRERLAYQKEIVKDEAIINSTKSSPDARTEAEQHKVQMLSEQASIWQQIQDISSQYGIDITKQEEAYERAVERIRKRPPDDSLKVHTSMIERISSRLTSMATMAIWSKMRNAWREATSFAKEYYDALNEIRIVTLMTEDEADALGEKYLQMARNLAVSATDVAKAAVTYYRQGLSGSEVDERLQATIKYANVAGIETEQAAEIVTSSVNAMGLDAQRVVDVLVYLGKKIA